MANSDRIHLDLVCSPRTELSFLSDLYLTKLVCILLRLVNFLSKELLNVVVGAVQR